MGRRSGKKKLKRQRDPFVLYTASVQSVETDLDFVEKVYRRRRKRDLELVREDFCATAALCCEWVSRGKSHRAVGVDLDRTTLAWARDQRLARLGDAAERVTLLEGDVRDVSKIPVDAILAFNFSYWIFKERAELLGYFRAAHTSLAEHGMFVIDVFGGTEAMDSAHEERRVKGEVDLDGDKIPAFTYVWEQELFNPVNCHISFEFGDGTHLERAFTYNWRFWSVAELRDLLAEAGFSTLDFYIDGFDENDEADGKYRRRASFDNHPSWVAYLVAYR